MYKYLLFISFILITCITNAQVTDYTLLFNQGKYQEVINETENILKTDTANTQAYLFKGLAEKSLYRYAESVKTFNNALEKTRDSSMFLIQLADAYELSGNTPLAEINYKRILVSDSLNIRARVKLGQIYLAKDAYIKAMNEYSTLAKQDTTNGYFYSQLAWCCYKSGFNPPVADYYLKAIELNPGDLDSKKKLVNFIVHTKQYDTALYFIDSFLVELPENIYLLKQKGYTEGLSGNYLNAVRTFEKVVELGDTSMFTAKYFGQSLYNNGQYDDAVLWLSRYLDKHPGDAKNQFVIAMAYRNDYQYEKSIDGFNKTLNLVYDRKLIALVFKEFAEGYIKYGDYIGFRDSTGTKNQVKYKMARDTYLQAEEIYPEDYTICKELGRLYETKINDLKLALYYYEKYYELLDSSAIEPYELNWIQTKITHLKEELHFAAE